MTQGNPLQTFQACVAWSLIGCCVGLNAADTTPGLQGASIQSLREVNRRTSQLRSRIQRLAAMEEPTEAEWQRLVIPVGRLEADIPSLRVKLRSSIGKLRQDLAVARDDWLRDKRRAGEMQQRLRQHLDRLTNSEGTLSSLDSRRGATARRRHRQSLRLARGLFVHTIENLLASSGRLAGDRARKLETLDALAHDLERVAAKITVYLGVLENTLPGLRISLEEGREIFRPGLLEKLTVLGSTPLRLTRSIEEIHERIRAVVRL